MDKVIQEALIQLKIQDERLFEKDVFHIVNGEVMYEDFKRAEMIGKRQLAPFNEAMCVHATTTPIFNEGFVQMRAKGHHVSAKDYRKKVIDPLRNMFEGNITCLVLWFGEDVFCQINVLTLLAWLEESNFSGDVYLNSFEEGVFRVTTHKIQLGSFQEMYKNVLLNHERPTTAAFPILQSGVEEFLQVQHGHHPIISYIKEHTEMSDREMVIQLLKGFPSLGYGDVQYMELVYMYR